MINVLTAIAWMFAIVAALPLSILAIEVLAGLVPHRRKVVGGGSPNVLVLIPAHDEGGGIATTLTALRIVAPDGTRVLVVADNCSDDTAARARAVGAEVIERQDPLARGKGYALAFGRDHVAAASETPPDVVVVLDADCLLLPGSIEALASVANEKGAPTQAINLIAPELGAAPIVQISGFAMVVKNLFRSRGMQRLGGAALLTGTGMAFPWSLFANAPLATGSIVEDLALGIEMTRQGYAPVLVEDAHVRSVAADMRDALQQRRRWEHGFLHTLKHSSVPVLLEGLKRGSLAEILLGLHLLVPPLALILMLSLTILALVVVLGTLGAGWTAVLALATVIGLALSVVGLAWLVGGRAWLSARALLRVPSYILWKLPLYASFMRKPESSWTRTPRRDL